MTASPAPKRRVSPLARRTRVRLLQQLLQRAESGDAPAAEALVRLSIDAERAQRDRTPAVAEHEGAGA